MSNLEKIGEKLFNNDLKLVHDDDKFTFDCNACGKCCRNRNDIIVSPMDVFYASKFLKIKTEDFISKYTNFNVGPNSGWVIVTVKFKDKSLLFDGSDTVCSFLKRKDDKFLCSIHEAKPFMCLSYPMGRAMEFKKDTKEGLDHINYFLQDDIGCGDGKTQHTVKEWLRGDHKEADEFFIKYNTFMSKMLDIINLHKFNENKDILGSTKDLLMGALLSGLYLKYDIEKPFMPQFEQNCTDLLSIFTDIVNKAKEMKLNW